MQGARLQDILASWGSELSNGGHKLFLDLQTCSLEEVDCSLRFTGKLRESGFVQPDGFLDLTFTKRRVAN